MTEFVRVDTEDWAALYVDGKLQMWADGYLVDEYLFYTVLGGKTEESDAYYRNMGDPDFKMPETLEEYRDLLVKSDDA